MAVDNYQDALDLHRKLKGKISVESKMDVQTSEELSMVYSPGVAAPCLEIAANPESVWEYTMKSNTVAIVTDGSAVLGLGNIGAMAALPVMEGKAMLFKKFANIDAFPICLDTQNTDEIVETVKRIAPGFGGINLEDIAAPRSFEIERRLQDIGIPVFHDDQHGTAIVTLAALINACKVVGKNMADLSIVINGAGAAGDAIARMLKCVGAEDPRICTPAKEVIVCDTRGIIHRGRADLNEAKLELASFTNIYRNRTGTLRDALKGADVFIGVSKGDVLKAADIKLMAPKAIVFALANPTPEIMPDEALRGGAAVVGTGRSDFGNQINNVLGYPGIFRGALDARAKSISLRMKLAAAAAIAELIPNPTADYIIPSSLNLDVAYAVAAAVKKAAESEA